jgi:hypothetical protein
VSSVETATEHAQRMSANVVAWIEANLGKVVAIERQARWRPAWFVEVEREGGRLPLYVRGSREGARNVYPLDQEAGVLRVLEAHGIPVPHVYGMIDQPWAIVMDKLPGRANLANVEDDGERRAILAEYMDIMARIHAIDPKEFLVTGLTMPADAAEHALSWFNGVEDRYRSCKKRPEPLLEFTVKWVRRNVPAHGVDSRFILGDPGQFMFEDGRITGLLDFEFSHIGDTAHDLSSIRLRDVPEPFGDVGGGLLRYEAQIGKPLDLALIDFHTVKWVMCTPLSLIATLHDPPEAAELMQYVEWFHQYSLIGIEGIGNMIGVSFPDVGLPEASPSRYGWVHDVFPPTLRTLEGSDAHSQYRRDRTAATAEYLRRADAYGPAVEAANLDDIAELLGERPADWQAGDAALEVFVLAAGPEHDAALVRLFHRREMRQMRLLEPILYRTKTIRHLDPLPEVVGRR